MARVVACLPVHGHCWLSRVGQGLALNLKLCRKSQAKVLGSKTGIQLYATAALWGNRMDLSIWPVEKGESTNEHSAIPEGVVFVPVWSARGLCVWLPEPPYDLLPYIALWRLSAQPDDTITRLYIAQTPAYASRI